MKQLIVVLLLISLSQAHKNEDYTNEVVENQSASSDDVEDISSELLALIEDGKVSIDDIVGENFVRYILNEILKESDVQDRTWRKCISVQKSFRIVFKRFRFSVTACAEFTWLSRDYGVRITLTVGRLRVTRTISLRNPPGLCYGVPGFKLARVCLELYDINLGSKSGCVRLSFKFLRWGWKMRLGCFRLYHVLADDNQSTFYEQNAQQHGDKNNKLGLLQEESQSMDLLENVE